jgi:hypothetical protein
MTKQTTPEAILNRVTFLHNVTESSTNLVTQLLETALRDAVQWAAPTEGQKACPIILTQHGLVQLQQLKKNISSLLDLYRQQLTQLQGLTQSNSKPAAEGPSASQMHTAIEQLRQLTERVAADNVLATAADPQALAQVQLHADEVPRQLADGTPLVSGARAVTAARLAESLEATEHPSPEVQLASRRAALAGLDLTDGSGANEALPKIVSSGLPQAEPLRDVPVPKAPENSLLQLLSIPTSPMLDIFTPSPWLPEGRGLITVGSTGLDGTEFRWYKNVEPLVKQGLDRAKLPGGFYGGPERPTHVVLRLKSVILVWSFELEPECISAYLVGLSDAQDTPRWFTLKELSATFTRRILQEVRDYAVALHAAR